MVSRLPESRRERATVLCLVLWGDRNYTVWNEGSRKRVSAILRVEQILL